jgi:hypothetical protein
VHFYGVSRLMVNRDRAFVGALLWWFALDGKQGPRICRCTSMVVRVSLYTGTAHLSVRFSGVSRLMVNRDRAFVGALLWWFALDGKQGPRICPCTSMVVRVSLYTGTAIHRIL